MSLLLKLLYIGFAFLLEFVNDDFNFTHNTEGVIGIFKRHDTYWYKKIHDNGYPEVNSKLELGWHDGPKFHQSSWGFMPGYPMTVKIISSIFDTKFETSAFALSIIFSTLCFILFYWLSTLWLDANNDSLYATLLFMVMPFQYYFSMMYSEAFFCSLLIGSLIAVTKKNYLLLAILCSIMTLVRANGLVMLLPVALFVLESENLIISKKLKTEFVSWKSLKKITFLLLPILFFSGYCIYQYIKTGFPNAYSIAQQGGWYRELMFPLAGLFRSGDFASQFNSWYAIVFMIIACFAWKKLPLSFNLIIWLNILLPLSAGSSVAMPRYISIIFPLFIMFSFWLKNLKWKMALIPILLIAHFYTFYFWLISDRFSQ